MRRFLCLGCSVFLISCGTSAPAKFKTKQPVPVEIAVATLRDVPRVLSAVGNAQASEAITIRPQVTALLLRVLFTEGDTVAVGTPLFQLDDRPFLAAVQQAEAEHMRAQANERQLMAGLEGVRARYDLAVAMDRRARDLVGRSLMSDQDAEQAHATLVSARADMIAAEAAIATAHAGLAVAEAAVAKYRLEHAWCTIQSPIAGRTGAVGLQAGNLVVAHQSELVLIARIQPMRIDFSVPGAFLGMIQRAKALGDVVATAVVEQHTDVETGTLSFIDNHIDQATGAIRLRAVFANTAARLWPGQVCRVNLMFGNDAQVLTVPEKAIQTGQRGAYVWVVQKDRTVVAKDVNVSRSADGVAVISDGIVAGATVVTVGQFLLAPGAQVLVSGAPDSTGPNKQ